MVNRIKAAFAKKEPLQESFTGFGVVLLCDVGSLSSSAQALHPVVLVEAMKQAMAIQAESVRRFGGAVDKHVGGSLIAYWPPEVMPRAINAASAAARAMIGESSGGVLRLRASFAAADFTVDASGPVGARQVQIVGRAYERAEGMLASQTSNEIITDLQTFEMLSPAERTGFVVDAGYARSKAT